MSDETKDTTVAVVLVQCSAHGTKGVLVGDTRITTSECCGTWDKVLHHWPRVPSDFIARALDQFAALRAPAPSEAVDEDERCEVCVERRATIHLEGAVNELCAECHIERLERVVNGPVGETRRLLASFIQRVGDNCRLDADGYCQGHFLERGDECTVKRARDLLATHPAPARGVTEEQAADVLFWMASAARNGKPLAPILTAALTPDAEGGA